MPKQSDYISHAGRHHWLIGQGNKARVLAATRRRRSRTIREIADAVGLSQSTVHSHLSSLLVDGLVVKVDDGWRRRWKRR